MFKRYSKRASLFSFPPVYGLKLTLLIGSALITDGRICQITHWKIIASFQRKIISAFILSINPGLRIYQIPIVLFPSWGIPAFYIKMHLLRPKDLEGYLEEKQHSNIELICIDRLSKPYEDFFTWTLLTQRLQYKLIAIDKLLAVLIN